MLKKPNLYFSMFLFAIVLNSTNTYAYDTIKQEDEKLLKDVLSSDKVNQIHIKAIDTEIEVSPAIVSKKEIQKAPYIYPSKEDISSSRQEQKEWFVPRTQEIKTMPSAPKDPLIEEIKEQIHNCMANKSDELDVEKSLLKQGNFYNNVAYLSQTFEDINTCYENIGYDIISLYYNDNQRVLNNFEKKKNSFYVTGTTPSFKPTHCKEDCTFDAVVETQLDKFKEFRTYLSELLANRPGNI